MKRKRSIVYIICLCIIAVGTSGCEKGRQTKAGNEAMPVKVMKVSLEDVSRTLEYVGDIKGQDEAIVYPKVTGKIIEKVKEEGDTVAKGDPIAYIDRDEVGLKFEKAPVEAPLSGRIGRIYVDIGSSVTMQTPIALVADMDKAEIYLKVPETYLPSIRIGQKAIVRVDAYPKEEFLGYVQNISPVIDLQTRSAPIEIVIDNPDHRLQSGMFAKVSLIIEEHRQNPAILKEAVIGRIEPFYVYVVEDGKARLRQVRLGARRGAYVEVIDGLKVGESVVIMGQQKLRDGASVTAEE
ncbi:MAG: efflux RND transporter periplasmic adaptor subunit [Candidatus Omnitrophica bacterium]|nr:efflux RND transporter periplasmic adaptor subunit [Candidatus Omnitrophota bacterium]